MVQTVRLSKKDARALAPASDQATDKFSAVSPAAAMYGIYGPQYAAMLAQPTDSAALQVLNAYALQNNAKNERDAYGVALDKANAVQADLQKRAGYYGILTEREKHLQGDVELGMGGVRGNPTINPQTGEYETVVDPTLLAVANGNTLNNDQAERYGVYAGGIKNLADAGMAPPLEDVGKLLTPPTQAEPAKYLPYKTPAAKIAEYSADEGLTAEEQMQIAQLKAAASANGDDDLEIAVTTGANGVAQVVAKGTPDALIRNGYDPVTGQKINPKAGANRGTAPAQTTTAPVAKASGKAAPLPQGSFFNQKNMTSRGGMRMHPIHKRMMNHDGDDFGFPKGTPIPAEADGVVVSSVKSNRGYGNTVKVKYDNGAIVSYSHNETNSVEPGQRIKKGDVLGKVGSTGQSTGPHVHRKVWAQGVQPKDVYAARLKQHPNVESVTPDGTGRLVVKLKSGRNVVVKDGKVIG